MNNKILVLLLLIISTTTFAQNPFEAERLVKAGITLHDKGDYANAIVKYDSALLVDKDNLLALAEKAMSLLHLENNEEAIKTSLIAIEKHRGSDDLRYVYVTCGNAYDAIKNSNRSLEIYEEGIKQFPDFYLLHFNKGITLTGLNKYDEAMTCFIKSVSLNPNHASSQNLIARISFYDKKNIPSILAYTRFLVLEPQSKRAKENFANLQSALKNNVEKTGSKSITISLDPNMFGDTTANGKPNENNFSTAELLLATSTALEYDKKNKKKSDVEKFQMKFGTLCNVLSETKKDNHGFYWDYYVPYFIELKEKNFLETFAYIVFATSEDSEIAKWLKNHNKEINEFYAWSEAYKW